jgi:hypothetical protein
MFGLTKFDCPPSVPIRPAAQMPFLPADQHGGKASEGRGSLIAPECDGDAPAGTLADGETERSNGHLRDEK